MGALSPKYASEFKARTVELYRKSGTAYAEVARGLRREPRSLSDWMKRAEAAGAKPGDSSLQVARRIEGPSARTR
jgi:transposase